MTESEVSHLGPDTEELDVILEEPPEGHARLTADMNPGVRYMLDRATPEERDVLYRAYDVMQRIAADQGIELPLLRCGLVDENDQHFKGSLDKAKLWRKDNYDKQDPRRQFLKRIRPKERQYQPSVLIRALEEQMHEHPSLTARLMDELDVSLGRVDAPESA